MKVETLEGEELLVDPHGHEAVAISVRCPRFGRISHVRLSDDQAAELAGALTGILLDRAVSPDRH